MLCATTTVDWNDEVESRVDKCCHFIATVCANYGTICHDQAGIKISRYTERKRY